MLDAQGDGNALRDEGAEIVALKKPAVQLLQRAHRRRAAAALDERHFAEHAAGPEPRHGELLAAGHDHGGFGRPALQDIGAARRLPVAHEAIPLLMGDRPGDREEERPRLVVEALEEALRARRGHCRASVHFGRSVNQPIPSPAPEQIDPNRVLRVVAGIVREARPQVEPQVELDSSLEKELGLDSLARIELVLRLEREFSASLPEQALATSETPRDLLRFLLASAGTRRGRPTPASRAWCNPGRAPP